ncbi:MAG TPA: nucleoside triphosphate pyrophosphohydrolase [Bacteroidales bacterium]|nr:nucleoside triphosphate pyrophosphohydrolase [Bacteroidales bacterium]HRZ48177.1 nucleoside triphosphate pyrophosphohydrolase [Bacteroidales bacterium]
MHEKALENFNKLLGIMNDLRSQCPWDREQTLESLRYLSIEEVYELSDAILEGDLDMVKKELGDLLLHVVFYARIGEEKGAFSIADVIDSINSKLVHRHPHIYGNVEANDAETVKNNWERIKLGEGKKSVLEGVPMSLPAMVKAYRIQEKARGVGFDWEKTSQVREKVLEELDELTRELEKGDVPGSRAEEEFGDLLFALINYSRFIGINPEDALEKTNRKFIRRFKHLENRALQDGRNLHDMTLAEMDLWWDEAKASEAQQDG